MPRMTGASWVVSMARHGAASSDADSLICRGTADAVKSRRSFHPALIPKSMVAQIVGKRASPGRPLDCRALSRNRLEHARARPAIVGGGTIGASSCKNCR